MQRLFHRLKNLFGFGLKPVEQVSSPLLSAPSAPDWLPENQAAWSQFLHSPAGVVMMARGRAVLFSAATASAKDLFHTAHSAGRTVGFEECLAWLESLSRSSRATEASASDDTEAKTDTLPTGELELRERFSP